jgi:hypothetical protein
MCCSSSSIYLLISLLGWPYCQSGLRCGGGGGGGGRRLCLLALLQITLSWRGDNEAKTC